MRTRIRGRVLAGCAASCARCGRAVALAGPSSARFTLHGAMALKALADVLMDEDREILSELAKR